MWLPETAHPRYALPPCIAGEQRIEPVPLHPHRLVADTDPALEQQVLAIPQAQRIFHVHHHHEADLK